MPSRIMLAFIVLIAATITVFAQTNGETPSPAERQLTATALVAEASETALAQTGTPTETETPDSFVLTANALILHATQTSEASGFTPIPQDGTATPEFSEMSATELIENATATALASATENAVSESESQDGIDNPTNFTLIIFGIVVTILILGIIGFMYMNAENNTGNTGS